MSGLINLDVGGIVSAGGNLLDDMFTSDEERASLKIQEQQIDADSSRDQTKVNLEEGKHRSLFVAGWRPFIGWVGGSSLAYNFLLHPFLVWAWAVGQAMEWIPEGVTPPPVTDASQLYPIILGMLGLGTMRTVEGLKGKKTESLSSKKKSGFRWPWQ
ncbi:MAG: 3TM-type holin [Desulforhopalus sp.]